MKSRMPSLADYDRMINSSGPQEVLDYVRERRHASPGIVGGSLDPDGARAAIEDDYVSSVHRVSSLSPTELRKIVRIVLDRDELSALSHLLEGIALDVDPSLLAASIAVHGRLNSERIHQLAKTRPVRRAVESLEDKELKDSILLGLSKFGASHPGWAIEVAVNNLHARRLWRAMKASGGSEGPANLRRLLGEWFDLQNVALIARSKELGVETGTVEGFLLPVQYRMSKEEVRALLHTGSFASFAETLLKTRYRDGLSSQTRYDISKFQTGLDRLFARMCAGLFQGWRFTAALPVGFVFLKQYEAQDLRAILTGKVKGLSGEVIRSGLVLNQPT